MSMTSINFKANYIKQINIKTKLTKDCENALVELNSSDMNDMKTLREVARSWGYDTYAYEIYSNIMDEYSPVTKSSHVFAITKQKTAFESLNSEDILCVAQFTEGNINELDCIQVKPSEKYKKVGSSMLNAIKSIYSGPMYIHSEPLAVKFYQKNGCVQSKEENLDFYTNI